MDDVAFVPSAFAVPRTLEAALFRLEPLGPEHNAADYAAWSSSLEHIRQTPGFPDGNWPDGRSIDDNLRDLRRHADDFEQRRGFTYTVIDPMTGDVVGCVYIYPDRAVPGRAVVQSWVRESRAELDIPLWRAVSDGSQPPGRSRTWPTKPGLRTRIAPETVAPRADRIGRDEGVGPTAINENGRASARPFSCLARS